MPVSLDLSVVIPIYCEQENLAELYRRLTEVLGAQSIEYEILFIDDASSDDSPAMMARLHEDDPRVKIIRFARNFGHQAAITAGMNRARGDSVIIMDGDLQDPPEILPNLIAKKADGEWDVVYAIRRRRPEHIIIRSLYFIFYRLLKRMSYIEIPTDAGDFCIMGRRVIDQLNALPERNRFIRGLRSWVGFRQTGMEYERAPRAAGEPKYNFRSLFKLAIDGMISFSYVPLRISTYLGFALSVSGFLYAIYVVSQHLGGGLRDVPGWTTLLVSVLVLGGVQLLILGIMGEYLGRIYEEIKGRPHYIIDRTLGMDADEAPSAPEAPAPADEA